MSFHLTVIRSLTCRSVFKAWPCPAAPALYPSHQPCRLTHPTTSHMIHTFDEHSFAFPIKLLNSGSRLTPAETLLFMSLLPYPQPEDWYCSFKSSSNCVIIALPKRLSTALFLIPWFPLLIPTSACQNSTSSSWLLSPTESFIKSTLTPPAPKGSPLSLPNIRAHQCCTELSPD